MGVHLYVVMYICSMKFKWENKKKKLLPKVRALTQISDILLYVPVCCFTEIIEIQWLIEIQQQIVQSYTFYMWYTETQGFEMLLQTISMQI